MLDKIHLYWPREVDSKVLLQTYVQSSDIMFRIFVRYEDEVNTENLNILTEDDLNSNDNLLDRFIIYNNYIYVCTYNKLIECSKSIIEPYREIYFWYERINGNTDISISGGHDRAFFVDRLSETYRTKYRNTYWTKQFKALGCAYLYRFIITPDTDLSSCPVFCFSDHPLITNLKFDLEEKYYQDHLDLVRPWSTGHRPKVKILGPDSISPSGIAKFKLEVENYKQDYTFLVECKQGYAPNQEIETKNGVGEFKIFALGLESGDKLRFKINDKVWTNYAEKILDVR